MSLLVVSIVTKIRILKQITTYCRWSFLCYGCIYSNKDKNFKANHNYSPRESTGQQVVSIVTKIRILKQITTEHHAECQRDGCIYSNKDKNFKANHNVFYNMWAENKVVSIVTKIRILKQITTYSTICGQRTRLYL